MKGVLFAYCYFGLFKMDFLLFLLLTKETLGEILFCSLRFQDSFSFKFTSYLCINKYTDMLAVIVKLVQTIIQNVNQFDEKS